MLNIDDWFANIGQKEVSSKVSSINLYMGPHGTIFRNCRKKNHVNSIRQLYPNRTITELTILGLTSDRLTVEGAQSGSIVPGFLSLDCSWIVPFSLWLMLIFAKRNASSVSDCHRNTSVGVTVLCPATKPLKIYLISFTQWESAISQIVSIVWMDKMDKIWLWFILIGFCKCQRI